MKPELEINIPLNDNSVEKWGLAHDDSCVVVLRQQEDGSWEPFKAAWIPSYVALHMSAIAAKDISMSQAYDAAYHVMHGPKAGGAVEGARTQQPKVTN